MTRILPYGVNKGKFHQAVRGANASVELVSDVKESDLLLTTKNYYRRRTQALREAEEQGKPVYVLRKNTLPQIEQFIKAIIRQQGGTRHDEAMPLALQEAKEAAERIDRGERRVELRPQGAYIRHLQHEIAEKYGLASSSTGRESYRRVVIYPR